MRLKKVAASTDSPPPSSWLNDLKGECDVNVEILDWIELADGTVSHLIHLRSGSTGSINKVTYLLSRSTRVKSIHIMNNGKMNCGMLGIVDAACSPNCICKKLARACYLRRAEFRPRDGAVVWSFVVNEDQLGHLLTYLGTLKIKIEYVENLRPKGGDTLNFAQLLILRKALEKGYLDVPRRISTRDFATELGKTPASLSISVRRAIRRLVLNHLLHSTVV